MNDSRRKAAIAGAHAGLALLSLVVFSHGMTVGNSLVVVISSLCVIVNGIGCAMKIHDAIRSEA